MKPSIVWRLHQQRAFDQAMELQFACMPNKQELIEKFRRQFVEGVARAASREPFDRATEHTLRYSLQRLPYQEKDAPPPAAGPKEDWIEVYYRFIDDKIAEIVSVKSQNLLI